MTIHREGFTTILIVFLTLVLINLCVWFFFRKTQTVYLTFIIASAIFYLFIVSFFRFPDRQVIKNEKQIICPADGEIVVIENVFEDEYFHDQRKQVSIFMSPLNVHVNWYPMAGAIKFFKYHNGEYLVASHPKSSKLNERTTVVIDNGKGKQILVRQIAGALARRIVCYAKEGTRVEQGGELGFIKFGSRVDLFLPLNAKIDVKLHDKVTGLKTVIADF